MDNNGGSWGDLDQRGGMAHLTSPDVPKSRDSNWRTQRTEKHFVSYFLQYTTRLQTLIEILTVWTIINW